MERTETDPAIVLSTQSARADRRRNCRRGFWIGGARCVSVPRKEEAQRALVEAGFERVADCPPAIIGYVSADHGASTAALRWIREPRVNAAPSGASGARARERGYAPFFSTSPLPQL